MPASPAQLICAVAELKKNKTSNILQMRECFAFFILLFAGNILCPFIKSGIIGYRVLTMLMKAKPSIVNLASPSRYVNAFAFLHPALAVCNVNAKFLNARRKAGQNDRPRCPVIDQMNHLISAGNITECRAVNSFFIACDREDE